MINPLKCEIQYGKAFDVVVGGMSLPIIFQFKQCLPHSDVTINVNISDYLNPANYPMDITF